MNKQVILNALRKELEHLEECYYFDRAVMSYHWDKCDKSKPSTQDHYDDYKVLRNRVSNLKHKLKVVRQTIKAVKQL